MSKSLFEHNPLLGPLRVTCPFGAIDRYHVTPHNGVDFACNNAPIYAPIGGYLFSFTHPTGGLTLILKAKNGFRLGFCHLSSVSIPHGGYVAAGALIAVSGNTGRSSGPHLHFTVTLPTGKKVDPMQYFPVAGL
jgi:murein DD-endopeptidase